MQSLAAMRLGRLLGFVVLEKLPTTVVCFLFLVNVILQYLTSNLYIWNGAEILLPCGEQMIPSHTACSWGLPMHVPEKGKKQCQDMTPSAQIRRRTPVLHFILLC